MTDTLELDLGWRPGDLVRTRYRLQEAVTRPDGRLRFLALDELTGEPVELIFSEPHTEDVEVAERPPVFGQPVLPFEARESIRSRVRRRARRVARFRPSRRTQIALGVSVALVAGFVLWPRYSTVPELTGRSRTAAQRELARFGLKEGRVAQAHHDSVRVGAVISSDPDAGARAKRRSAVHLTLSKGPREADVPNVIGMSLARATDTLEAAGFRVRGTKDIYAVRTPRGAIVEQDPSGRTLRGGPVDLVVSRGRRPRSTS